MEAQTNSHSPSLLGVLRGIRTAPMICPHPSPDHFTDARRRMTDTFLTRFYERLKRFREAFEVYEADCLTLGKILEERLKQCELMQKEREEKLEALPLQLKFNVGGQEIETTKTTLLKNPSLLTEMLISGKWKPDDKGYYFIDRDAKKFESVLDYLQSGGEVKRKIQDELDFFWIVPEEEDERRKRRRMGDAADPIIQDKIESLLRTKWRDTEREIALVKKETNRIDEIMNTTRENVKKAEKYVEEQEEKVKLNVRGKKYITTKKTLRKGGEESVLAALASGRWTEGAEGHPIDRNSRAFARVLDYLRTGSREIAWKVTEELDYFGIADPITTWRGWKHRSNRKTWTMDTTRAATLTGHRSCIDTVYSMKNGQIASGSEDGMVKIWNPDGKCTATLSGHRCWIRCIVELRNGQLATGSTDKAVKIWDLDGRCTATLSGHTDSVISVTELCNGQIASGSKDETVKIWTLDGTCTVTIYGHSGSVFSVAGLSNGQLASGSADKTVKVWKLDGTCVTTFSGHKAPVRSIAELSNGQIVSGGGGDTLKIWTLDGQCTATLVGHTDSIFSVTGLSNGQLASGSADQTVKVWNIDGTCAATLSGHSGSVYSVAELSDGRIASGSSDNTLRIWSWHPFLIF
ncbi:WD-40 repeat-containing protein [Planoprotostelium fungivorum]|uniref:WD-40 repeat-containing protein n=1 Tax=Planoprotostelium fungivorum TaxID=1890364 RepID=A0A2P6MQZ0_9EUKA|nr:WD-40 repeat-containing protein [Planoprotostelium fungivorum]